MLDDAATAAAAIPLLSFPASRTIHPTGRPTDRPSFLLLRLLHCRRRHTSSPSRLSLSTLVWMAHCLPPFARSLARFVGRNYHSLNGGGPDERQRPNAGSGGGGWSADGAGGA